MATDPYSETYIEGTGDSKSATYIVYSHCVCKVFSHCHATRLFEALMGNIIVRVRVSSRAGLSSGTHHGNHQHSPSGCLMVGSPDRTFLSSGPMTLKKAEARRHDSMVDQSSVQISQKAN